MAARAVHGGLARYGLIVVVAAALLGGAQPAPAQGTRVGHLDIRIFTPPPTEAALTDFDIEHDPDTTDAEDRDGGQVFTNIDDDDNDASFDIDAADTGIAGENDLIKIQLSGSCTDSGLPCSPAGKISISATSGGNRIRVWDAPNKSGPIPLPAEFIGAVGPTPVLVKTLYVEGVSPSGALRDVELRVDPVDYGGGDFDTVKLSVLHVAGVAFDGRSNGLRDDNILDPDPNRGQIGGIDNVRVFPDARLSGTTVGAARDKVDLKVSLNLGPPIVAADIHLKPFDVDDPSSAVRPVDDRDGNESRLEDNRGAVGGRRAGQVDGADGDNIATLSFPVGTKERTTQFRVTMQPGDNFRVAASHDKPFLNQLRNRDSTDGVRLVDESVNAQPPDEAQRLSKVLTAWRFLNVETDTMVTTRRRLDPDDDADVLPTQPDTLMLFSYLQPLSIWPRTTSLAEIDDNDDIPFDEHTTDAEATGAGTPCFGRNDDRRLGLNRDEFWAVYLLSVFQGEPGADRDPDTEPWELGFTPPGIAGDDNCVIIYQENIRDITRGPIARGFGARGFSAANIERAVVVHEVGHTLDAQHAHREIMDGGWPEQFDDTAPANGRYDRGERVHAIPTIFADRSRAVMRAAARPGE